MTEPRVFVGSASENLEIVDALELELQGASVVERWDKHTFGPGAFTLEELTAASTRVDFAIFVVGREDSLDSRGKIVPSPRDNVIFEAGLFTAELGRERTFYVVDGRGTKIPTDWGGLGYLTFDATKERPRDKILVASAAIRARMAELKPRHADCCEARIAGSWWQFVENSEEGAVVSLFDVSLDGSTLRVRGRSWSNDGAYVATYSSQAAAFDEKDGILHYCWSGRHPRDESLPEYFGVGAITFSPLGKEATRGDGHYTTTKTHDLSSTRRKAACYLRATPEELNHLREGSSLEERRALVASKLEFRKGLCV